MRVPGLSLLPRHISGQIALLVIVSLTMTHLVFMGLFFWFDTGRRDNASPISRIGALVTISRLLAASPEEDQRRSLVDALRRSHPELDARFVPRIGDGTGAGDRDATALPDNLDFLAHEIGAAAGVSLSQPDDDTLQMRFADGAGLLTRSPSDALNRLHMFPLGNALLFMLICLTLVFIWAGRWVTAPLTQFARAAADFGLDREHEPLPVRGPQEIQAVTGAFNRMRERIAALMADRTRMLAAVGHDLRTPITRLRLRTEFLVDKELQRGMVRDLDHMGAMVESALSFLRTGQASENRMALDLPSLLKTVCDDFADMDRNVVYEGPDHLSVSGRPDDLVRAVENLVENAVRHGTAVTVRLTERPGGRAAIEVDDDGPGIPDADKESVVSPFVRADGHGNDGFGLGLSIAAGIIEAHGGSLHLADSPDGGLRATLELPKSLD